MKPIKALKTCGKLEKYYKFIQVLLMGNIKGDNMGLNARNLH